MKFKKLFLILFCLSLVLLLTKEVLGVGESKSFRISVTLPPVVTTGIQPAVSHEAPSPVSQQSARQHLIVQNTIRGNQPVILKSFVSK